MRAGENRKRQEEAELITGLLRQLLLNPPGQGVVYPDSGRLPFRKRPRIVRPGAAAAIRDMLGQQNARRTEFEIHVAAPVGGTDEKFDAAVTADRVLKFPRHTAHKAVPHRKEAVQPLAVILKPEACLRPVAAALGAEHIDVQSPAAAPLAGIKAGVKRGRPPAR